MDNEQNQDALRQNLKDAGCNKNQIESFIQFKAHEPAKNQLSFLAEQRRLLLAKLHKNQKKLDCLDYLIYSIKKNIISKE